MRLQREFDLGDGSDPQLVARRQRGHEVGHRRRFQHDERRHLEARGRALTDRSHFLAQRDGGFAERDVEHPSDPGESIDDLAPGHRRRAGTSGAEWHQGCRPQRQCDAIQCLACVTTRSRVRFIERDPQQCGERGRGVRRDAGNPRRATRREDHHRRNRRYHERHTPPQQAIWDRRRGCRHQRAQHHRQDHRAHGRGPARSEVPVESCRRRNPERDRNGPRGRARRQRSDREQRGSDHAEDQIRAHPLRDRSPEVGEHEGRDRSERRHRRGGGFVEHFERDRKKRGCDDRDADCSRERESTRVACPQPTPHRHGVTFR